jgi:hypothetical protein
MIYHLGIIDFLTDYNLFKRCETFLKTKIYMNPAALISCVPPQLYRDRFTKFVVKKVFKTHRVEVGRAIDEEMLFDSGKFHSQMTSQSSLF